MRSASSNFESINVLASAPLPGRKNIPKTQHRVCSRQTAGNWPSTYKDAPGSQAASATRSFAKGLVQDAPLSSSGRRVPYTKKPWALSDLRCAGEADLAQDDGRASDSEAAAAKAPVPPLISPLATPLLAEDTDEEPSPVGRVGRVERAGLFGAG
mmetsp:Transcript_61063/g.162126  ORF Transcript_61063/g.162126 Transcript_61063/m.162126 type:complete len:155 (+) Transcript_61063:232-696(+)